MCVRLEDRYDMSNNEVNNSDSEILPSKVPQLTKFQEYNDDANEIAASAWGILSKRFPNTAHVLCELNEVINHSQITLSEFRNTVSSFQMDAKNENIMVKKCKKLSDCKLFTRDASVSTIETQTSTEDVDRGNIFKAPDCRKSIKDACVFSNIDCLPEALSAHSIEDTNDTDNDNVDEDEDEDADEKNYSNKKKTLFSSFDSLFNSCGSYDLRYQRGCNTKASIEAVGDQRRVTTESGMFRIEKTHTFVKDDAVKSKPADKSIPSTRHELTITTSESSTSSNQDKAVTLSPTITTKDVVFKPVEGRISTPVDDRLITAIREPPAAPLTESIHPSRETSRLSTSINEQQNNSLLNNPSIQRRTLRASSIPISQNLAKISPKKQSRIPRKSPCKNTFQ